MIFPVLGKTVFILGLFCIVVQFYKICKIVMIEKYTNFKRNRIILKNEDF
jgi:hypothetical protein